MRHLLGYDNSLYTAHGDQYAGFYIYDGTKAMLEHAISQFSSIALEIMGTSCESEIEFLFHWNLRMCFHRCNESAV